jgi:hypothetical protein
VETDTLTAREREAFLALLDDPHPAVRRALLARFRQLGPVAALFLQAVAAGPNRVLARHAARFHHELDFRDPVADFRRFIRAGRYDLETGSLLLARVATPRLPAAALAGPLDALAGRCRELLVEPSSHRERCRIVNRVLFHEWGFRGNVGRYTDPRNSFLDQVLGRRTGIPVSLSIVYLLVGDRLGLELAPVGLPGRVVVGCFADELPFYVDPFAGGVFRDAAELSALRPDRPAGSLPFRPGPTPIREILCRSCRNLVLHCTAAGEPARARLFAGFVADFDAAPVPPPL